MSLSKAFCKMGERIEGEQGFLSEKAEAGTIVTLKAISGWRQTPRSIVLHDFGRNACPF